MNGISTANTKLLYCVESVAGTRPTSGYVRIHNCKSIPDFNTEPNQLDTTTLDNEEWMSNTEGLKDLGGAKGHTLNYNSETVSEWSDFVTAYETGQASGLDTWICYLLPDDSAFYFKGKPSPLGFGGAEVNAVLETTGYITVAEVYGFDTKPASLISTPNVVAAVVGTNQTTTLSNRVGTCTGSTSNAGVATVSVSSNTVTITPVAAGSCVITITDGTTHEAIPIFVTVTAS